MAKPNLAGEALAVAPRTVHVVVQTHWDREWYLTREATLARSADVMSQVLDLLDQGQLSSFLFDGQTAAFEDLLAVAEPALAQRLRQHAANGRIVLGPWYVMADEFLVSGESLLRNLELGLADAARRGPGAQRVGYLPDSFGHVAQMPQLLQQFGIHQAVLWRGADAHSNRFDWVAPNGDAVGTVALPEGYYQHPLSLPQWRDNLLALLAKLAARTPVGPLLLTQGGDHLAPLPSLAARIEEFNTTQSDWRLEVSTLQAHTDAALASRPPQHDGDSTRLGDPPIQRIEGELRHNQRAYVLPDVLSTRRHLKLAHQRCEDRLLAETEPLLARLWPATAPDSAPYPTAALQRAWRLLIEQQAHDSICGCSTDAVHTEMQQRFVQLHEQLDTLRQRLLATAGAVQLTQHSGNGDVWADDSLCTLFNPLPLRRNGWCVVSAFLRGARHHIVEVSDVTTALAATQTPPLQTAAGTDHTAETGRSLPCAVLDITAGTELISPLDDVPQPVHGHRYTLAVQANLPGLSALKLRLRGTPPPTESQRPDIEPEPNFTTLDSSAWHVALDADQQLVFTDKRAGRKVPCALSLLSELDAGDSYNYSPPQEAQITHHTGWKIASAQRWVTPGGTVQELTLTTQMSLPAGLDATRAGASTAQVTNHGTLCLRVFGDEPRLCAQLHWHNAARDQRTRLLLPWPIEQGNSTHSDTAFDWTARPVRLAQVPAAPIAGHEMPVVVMPSLSAIAAGPWSVAHRAMQEFEVLQHAGQRWLGLTLARSVGWMSRRDLRTRGGGAGPDIATPDAQCLGDHVFDFWFCARRPHDGPTRALQAGASLRRPPLLLRGHPAAPLPTAIEIGNPVVQTSAVRRGADGRLELRLWNPTGEAQPLALDPKRWDVVRADGTPLLNAGDARSHGGSGGTDSTDGAKGTKGTKGVKGANGAKGGGGAERARGADAAGGHSPRCDRIAPHAMLTLRWRA